MSRFAHRQPVLNWGIFGVVLLSTLLLSPVAGTALWHTLFTAAAQSQRQSAPLSGPQSATPGTEQGPRRVSLDEEALRAAARSGQLRAIRLDTDPDNPEAAAIAFVVPLRSVLLVSDEPVRRVSSPPFQEAVRVPPAASPASPRAPPLLV